MLSKIPYTSLVTLHSRAAHNDMRALAILARLQKLGFEVPQSRDRNVLLRSEMFDHMVSQWIYNHPDGKILNLGCGFCTRFYEVDNGTITWIDADLPEIIDTWHKIVRPNIDRHRRIAIDLMEPFDIEIIRDVDLIIAEGVFMFIDKKRAVAISRHAATIFDIRAPDNITADMKWGSNPPFSPFWYYRSYVFGDTRPAGWVVQTHGPKVPRKHIATIPPRVLVRPSSL